MLKAVRWAFWAIWWVSSGCILGEVSLDGRGCPCIAGFECDETQNLCVPEGSLGRDATVLDRGVDTGIIVVDLGFPDAATDSGWDPPDAGFPDALPDAATDSGFPDAAPDAGFVDGGTACRIDTDCAPPSQICQNGQCAAGCANGGAMCTAPFTCDPASGRCMNANAVCTQDSQCGHGAPFGQCLEGRCRYGCGAAPAACTGDRQCLLTGFCRPSPRCTTTDPDCGDPDFVCVADHCVRRCDQPGAHPCYSGTCGADGRCSSLPFGATCTAHGDCASGQCLELTSPPGTRFCTQRCSATGDCLLDASCLPVSSANLCIPDRLASTDFDIPSGGACTNPGNDCQSGICTSNLCVERCSRRADCSGLGTECQMLVQGTGGNAVYVLRCASPPSGAPAGQPCASDSVCRSNVCDRYYNRCADGCCSEAECPVNQTCAVYDFDDLGEQNGTICQNKAGAGTGTYGQTCTQNLNCESEHCFPRDPANLGGPKVCTSHCCTDFDCAAVFPAGGRCATFPGPFAGAQQKACVPR